MWPRLPKRDFSAIRRTLEQGLPKLERKARSWPHREVISKWEHQRIFFVTETKLSGGSLVISFVPVGPDAWLWIMISNGVPRHEVHAKPGGVLAFHSDYDAVTKPGGPPYTGSGKSSGEMVFVTKVTTEIRPRNFERYWIIWIRTWFPQEIQNLLNQGVRAAKGAQ